MYFSEICTFVQSSALLSQRLSTKHSVTIMNDDRGTNAQKDGGDDSDDDDDDGRKPAPYPEASEGSQCKQTKVAAGRTSQEVCVPRKFDVICGRSRSSSYHGKRLAPSISMVRALIPGVW